MEKKCMNCLHFEAREGTYCPVAEKDMTVIQFCEENYILDPEKVEPELDAGIYLLNIGIKEDDRPHLIQFNKLDPDMMYKIVYVDDKWMIETFEKIAKEEPKNDIQEPMLSGDPECMEEK